MQPLTIKKIFSFWNLAIFSVLLLSLIVRIYRLPELLGFWYDQGRDALVIWDFIHKGKMFLIGPMMGFTGMFRGPWYYYLLTPFYFLGGGDPLVPTYFLVLTSVIAGFVLYKLGVELGGKKTGILALVFSSFSVYIIGASRWLSNPTPMLLLSVLLIWTVFKMLEKKWWSFPLSAFLIGMGLNFGAATEVFYLPAVILVVLLTYKKLPKVNLFLVSAIALLFTFLPQIFFELRHRGVLSGALRDFVVEEKSFSLNIFEIAKTRLIFDYNLIASKFWVDGSWLFLPFFLVLGIFLIVNFRNYWHDSKFKVLFLFFLAPFIGTLFFVSNLGGIYEYYFTGYYMIIILFFAYLFAKISDKKWGKLFVGLFLTVFLFQNIDTYRKTYFVSLNHPQLIAYENQLMAMDWIFADSANQKFNVDVYVPPVIPYAYDYLFGWQEYKRKDFRIDREKQINLLYTLYEVDPPHPERLDAWQKRQDGIGKIVKEIRFGGIVVQRRERYVKQ